MSIELYFSDEIDCNQLRNAISVTSTAETEKAPSFQNAVCENINDTTARVSEYTDHLTNQIPAVWKISGNLVNVSDGVHLVDIVTSRTKPGTPPPMRSTTSYFALVRSTTQWFSHGLPITPTCCYTRMPTNHCMYLTRLLVRISFAILRIGGLAGVTGRTTREETRRYRL